MKYICTIGEENKQEIFTFSRSINHDVMAEAISRMRNQSHGNWHRIYREAISAGFVDSNNVCYGESETLGLESREEDTALLAKQL